MAHLEVEPKPKRPMWVWIILFVILALLAMSLLRKCDAEHSDADRAAAKDTTIIASTGPDWKNVDLNSASTTDADITDSEIQIRSNGTYTIYSLGENILFPTGENDISENGKAKLSMISDVLKKRFNGADIGVFGSTDSIDSADQNRELGRQRASSVKDWLTSTGQIPTETVSIQSFGENEPVATNQTTEGRKQNRNVSIVVFPKK